jgi:hypothetical protein
MSISINNLLSQFRVQLPILTTLPEVVPAGAEFYYQGTKWRGLGAGETGLPEGTPWPVKGYKEVVLRGLFANPNYTMEKVIDDVGIVGFAIGNDGGTGEISSIDPQTKGLLNDTANLIMPNFSKPEVIVSYNREEEVIRAVDLQDLSPNSAGFDFGAGFTIRIYPPQP